MEFIGMDACVQCGSIRIRVISGGLFQRVLALLLNQQVIVCGRCGWRGRQRRSKGGSARTRASAGDATRPDGRASRGVDLDALDRSLERDAEGAPKPRGGH